MKVEIRSKVVILLCIVLAVFSSCITAVSYTHLTLPTNSRV